MQDITWKEPPKYQGDEPSIQPPTDKQCTALTAGAHGTLSLKIDISIQTGLRPIEIQGNKGLRAKNIHMEQKTITSINTKRTNARPAIPISEELTARLKTYITTHNIKPDELLFKGKPENYTNHFIRLKHRLSKQLEDQEILKIRLYDLRHYYITKQLRRTQNCETVRIIVGHKNLNTTQKYLHLLGTPNGEWTIEGTTDTNRAKQLLAEDFTYQLTAPDGTMIFRKPK
jgi:integrase